MDPYRKGAVELYDALNVADEPDSIDLIVAYARQVAEETERAKVEQLTKHFMAEQKLLNQFSESAFERGAFASMDDILTDLEQLPSVVAPKE